MSSRVTPVVCSEVDWFPSSDPCECVRPPQETPTTPPPRSPLRSSLHPPSPTTVLLTLLGTLPSPPVPSWLICPTFRYCVRTGAVERATHRPTSLPSRDSARRYLHPPYPYLLSSVQDGPCSNSNCTPTCPGVLRLPLLYPESPPLARPLLYGRALCFLSGLLLSCCCHCYW